MKCVAALCLVVASASAFVAPMAPVSGVAKVSTTARRAYVPDGITAEQYAKMKADDAAKKAARKKEVKGKTFEDITTWMKKRDAKYPGQLGAGHTFAKIDESKTAVLPTGALPDEAPKKKKGLFGN